MSVNNRHIRRSFKFKQFAIHHDRCAMPLSTDSVLLGAWVPVNDNHYILDVGSGCGILSLMIAQRNPTCLIDAIEIDPESQRQGLENIRNSRWSDRIQSFCDSFQNFVRKAKKKYDHVVCNPPFFQNDLKSPYPRRALSKHAQTLSFTELIEGSTALLTDIGMLSVIIPYNSKNDFVREGLKQGLFCIRETNVRMSSGMPFLRSLLTLSPRPQPIIIETLTLYENNKKTFTVAYADLTREFYLNIPEPAHRYTE